MRIRIMLTLTVFSLLLLPLTAGAADRYKIDPLHTTLTFSIRHLGINNVKGHFDEFEGWVLLDNNEIQDAGGIIRTKSINTGVKDRDDHLRTAEFFDAAKYPLITFKTRKVEKVDDKTVLVADFTIHGVTRELRLPVKLNGPIKDHTGATRIGLEAKAQINRKDFGINYNEALETGTALVGEEVFMEINAEAVKETSAKPAG